MYVSGGHLKIIHFIFNRGHRDAEVTSEVSGSDPGPYVGKLVVTYRWSAVYSTKPSPTVCIRFCPKSRKMGEISTLPLGKSTAKSYLS